MPAAALFLVSSSLAAEGVASPAPPPPLPAPWTFVTWIEPGEGPGRLSAAPAAERWPPGPAAFRAGPEGGIVLLDSLEAALEAFDAAGRPLWHVPLPLHDEGDAESAHLDLCFAGEGRWWVLDAGGRRLLLVRPGEGLLGARPLGESIELPERLALSPAGAPLVLDGASGEVHEIGARATRRFAAGVTADLVLGAGGEPLVLEHDGSGEIRLATLGGRRLGALRPPGELADMQILDTDARGRVLVGLSLESLERSASSSLLLFDPDRRPRPRIVLAPLPAPNLASGAALGSDGSLLLLIPGAGGALGLIRHPPLEVQGPTRDGEPAG